VENFSIATVYGLYYFGRGILGTESFSMFVRYDSLAQNYFTALQHFSPIIYEEHQRFQLKFPLFHNMTIRYLTEWHQKNKFLPVLLCLNGLSSNHRRVFFSLFVINFKFKMLFHNYILYQSSFLPLQGSVEISEKYYLKVLIWVLWHVVIFSKRTAHFQFKITSHFTASQPQHSPS
jgi:hypothetical protein